MRIAQIASLTLILVMNWAIVNGELETGITTIEIVPELDAGPILLQRKRKLDDHETAPQALSSLAEMGAELISETLRALELRCKSLSCSPKAGGQWLRAIS